jgi:hypothetical protein
MARNLMNAPKNIEANYGRMFSDLQGGLATGNWNPFFASHAGMQATGGLNPMDAENSPLGSSFKTQANDDAMRAMAEDKGNMERAFEQQRQDTINSYIDSIISKRLEKSSTKRTALTNLFGSSSSNTILTKV